MTVTSFRASLNAAKSIKSVPTPNDPTEDSIAQQFANRHAGSLLFDHTSGKWSIWTGKLWRPDSRRLAFNFAREACQAFGDQKRALSKAATAAGVERFAQADPKLSTDASFWNSDHMLLGTPDGTVDLRTGTISAPLSDHGISKSTSVKPKAGVPQLWIKFLREACDDDMEMVAHLQRVCGYLLTGDTREHALFFIYGPGGNGKGVFLNLVIHILGEYATNAAIDTFTASKFDKHSTDLAMLQGARGVFASETEEGKAWAEARIKSLTGGDPITARFMRQDNFSYVPQFKLMIAGNHAPKLQNVDDAMRRRFNLIPFLTKPITEDKQLGDKLLVEAPMILAWMIEGCLAWQSHGLARPETVRLATEKYFTSQDVLALWMEARCVAEPGNSKRFCSTTELFQSWSEFAKEAGETPGNVTSFTPKLEMRGFRRIRLPLSLGKVSGFQGISLQLAKGD